MKETLIEDLVHSFWGTSKYATSHLIDVLLIACDDSLYDYIK